MSFRITMSIAVGSWEKSMKAMSAPIADAAKEAAHEAAMSLKDRGRAHIAQKGFSTKWQNAFRVDVYPKGRRRSIDAAIWAYHRIHYAGIFETGGQVSGKPLLWLPMSSAPKTVGRGKRFTIYNYKGKLHTMRSKSGTPLLAARVRLSKRKAKKPSPKVTMAELNRGTSGEGVLRSIPLFHGVSLVSIRKKFDFQRLFKETGAMLPGLYARALTVRA